jgi:DNA-binding response OmpR family regulator
MRGMIGESLADYLRDTFQVAAAGNDEEALELIEKPDFDVW